MMRRLLHISLCALFAFAALLSAKPSMADDVLAVDLSDRSINITTGFNGARLSIHGVKMLPGDVALTFTGPERRMVVRRKDKVFGMWMNRESMTFRNIPAYYDFATSRPLQNITDRAVLEENTIGLDFLNLEALGRASPQDVEPYREALIRNKQVAGLYALEPETIGFINNQFFRVDFDLPPNVPSGEYKIETYLINEGVVVGRHQSTLRIGQVGASASIYKFANQNEIFYGFAAVLLALMSGIIGYYIMRRD